MLYPVMFCMGRVQTDQPTRIWRILIQIIAPLTQSGLGLQTARNLGHSSGIDCNAIPARHRNTVPESAMLAVVQSI